MKLAKSTEPVANFTKTAAKLPAIEPLLLVSTQLLNVSPNKILSSLSTVMSFVNVGFVLRTERIYFFEFSSKLTLEVVPRL